MSELTVKITVIADGKRYTEEFTESGECDLYSLSLERSDWRTTVTITPKLDLTMCDAEAIIPWKCGKRDRILLNGYQSWSLTRELTANDRMIGLNHSPKWAIKRFGLDKYGDYHIADYSGKKGEQHGYSYGYIRRGDKFDFIGSMGERDGYTILRWSNKTQNLRVCRDCSGLEISAPYTVLDFVRFEGGHDEVFDHWFEALDIAAPKVKPVVGYTSWYHHYENINEKIIKENFDGLRTLPVKADVFQIDDGFEVAVGDWLECDPVKFPNGVKGFADKAHEAGMLAGLWLAPFVCETKSRIYKEHPDWLRRDANGEPVYCGCNWSGFYALDLYNPEVVAYLEKVFDTVLNEWGFDIVKLDFLYAAALVAEKDKTRGQQMCEAMDLLRRLVGDKLILGCGVPLMPSFGKVDYCRIGCDVSLDWNDKLIMRIIHRERVSTRNSICDTIYRRGLDGRAFLNDPDVFYLRDENLHLSKKRKLQLATVNNLFASLRFVSDNCSLYNEKTRGLYSDLVSLREKGKLLSLTDNSKSITFEYEHNGSKEKMSIKL